MLLLAGLPAFAPLAITYTVLLHNLSDLDRRLPRRLVQPSQRRQHSCIILARCGEIATHMPHERPDRRPHPSHGPHNERVLLRLAHGEVVYLLQHPLREQPFVHADEMGCREERRRSERLSFISGAPRHLGLLDTRHPLHLAPPSPRAPRPREGARPGLARYPSERPLLGLQLPSGTASALLGASAKRGQEPPGSLCVGHLLGTMARWHDGTMARWHDGTMARWHDGTMARWHDGTMAPAASRPLRRGDLALLDTQRCRIHNAPGYITPLDTNQGAHPGSGTRQQFQRGLVGLAPSTPAPTRSAPPPNTIHTHRL
jgi:hypothetical protein